MAVRERIWVGIDVGKTAHHACAVDGTGKVVFSQRVDNGQAAIEQLIARAGKAAVEVRWAVDLTSGAAGLLVVLLLTTGQPVAYVSGQTVNRMAGAFGGEGKTDAKDARVIAQTCRMRADLPELSVPDPVVTDLAVLTARRSDLMNDWVRDVNRLRELLSSVFPVLEKALDCTTRAALSPLTGFQTPAAVRDAGEPGLTRHLHDLGVRPGPAHTVTAKALAAAAGQTVALPAEAVTAPLIARLARQLLDLDREAKDLTTQIGDTFRAHPQAAIIESLPGLGPVLGAELLIGTGGDLTTFRGPDKLAAFAGLAPMPRDSGRISGNLRKPRRHHRGLRRVFSMAALVSAMREGPSRTFYQRKRTEGKHHIQALIALARRLVDVLWALLRDNRPFTSTIANAAATPTVA